MMSRPRDALGAFRRIAVNVRQLGCGKVRVLFGPAIHLQPREQPQEAGRADDRERPLPAIVERQKRDGERREDRADVRAAIEDAGRQRALASSETTRRSS